MGQNQECTRKIKKNDRVVVLSGDEKGKTGKVVRILTKRNAVIVEGLNKVKRHVRGTAEQPGRIEDREAPLHLSNVALWNEERKSAVRVGWKVLTDGRKVRIDRATGDQIDKD